MDEILVLQDQLAELLADEPDDPEDALELAMVAGLLERLHPESPVLLRARAWRDGAGQAALVVGWDELDAEEHLEDLEDALAGQLEGEDLEEALLDLDELAAAAEWSGLPEVVRPISLRVAGEIRMLGDLFEDVADLGREMARSVAVARDPDLYSFWMAVAEADVDRDE